MNVLLIALASVYGVWLFGFLRYVWILALCVAFVAL